MYYLDTSFAAALVLHEENSERAAAALVTRQFEVLIAASFELLLPTRRDFEQARRYLAAPRTTLRGGDALHLAVAVNHGVRAMLTFDRELIRAGRRLGVPVASTLAHAGLAVRRRHGNESEHHRGGRVP